MTADPEILLDHNSKIQEGIREWKTRVRALLAEVPSLAASGVRVDMALDTIDAIIDVESPETEDPEPFYAMVNALRRLYVHA